MLNNIPNCSISTIVRTYVCSKFLYLRICIINSTGKANLFHDRNIIHIITYICYFF